MSKRLKSELNFAPQLKKHIGEIDVPYVYDRQSIYNKTINLLFEGAKNQSKIDLSRSLNGCSISSCVNTKDNLKQMIMNNNCQLQTKTLLDRSIEISITQFDKCSFCEKFGCFTTLMRCSTCEELFCDDCSFPLYRNSANDGSSCLSCFK